MAGNSKYIPHNKGERIECAFDPFLQVGGRIGGYRFRVTIPNSGTAPRFAHVTAATPEKGRVKISKLNGAAGRLPMMEVQPWFATTANPAVEQYLKSRYAAKAGRDFSFDKADRRSTLLAAAA